MASKDYGYPDDRFENAVSENFHCSICLNVFKEPKMCRNNQHLFCSACIIRHLANSSRCPECNEELTVETLSQAPRVLLNCLFELKVTCDYFSRGCREFVQLGNLPSHVRDCAFAPVTCSHQFCGLEINKRDRIHHETEVCRFRKVECHDCGEMKKKVEQIKVNQTEMNDNIAELKKGVAELKADVVEMKAQLPSLKEDIVNEVRGIMRDVLTEMNVVRSIKPPLCVDSVTKKDFIVAGGCGKGSRLCSVETYSWANRTWTRLPPMKDARSSASSFVYKNQVLVAGGHSGFFPTAKIAGIKIDNEPLRWSLFPAELPAPLAYHKTVLLGNSENRLIVVGGFNLNKIHNFDGIYEVLLVHPYSTKFLCSMPQPRRHHGVEFVTDKIYILGGTTTSLSKDALNSVIAYDIVNNKCEIRPPLPYAVRNMSTVSWQTKVIVLGGQDKKGKILNDVIMYDIVTGESERLPSMKYRRCGCSAIITADCIVVMGGQNLVGEILNTAEYFPCGSNSWQELPPMTECRSLATAAVKPY